jgi:hypothetical protein
VFDNAAPPIRHNVKNGHDDWAQFGVIVADRDSVEPSRLGYYPDEQTWVKIPANDHGVWVGFYNNDRPSPKELIRTRNLIPGHMTLLADQQKWLVPIARGASDNDGQIVWYNALPTTSILDDKGEWLAGDVCKEHEYLWQLAMNWDDSVRNAVVDDDDQESETKKIIYNFNELHHSTVKVLQTNYRVSGIECALLGLLTEQVCVEVMNALIDWPTRMEILKKNLNLSETHIGGDITTDGGSDCTEDTDQA